jgi:hypothetical protein
MNDRAEYIGIYSLSAHKSSNSRLLRLFRFAAYHPLVHRLRHFYILCTSMHMQVLIYGSVSHVL